MYTYFSKKGHQVMFTEREHVDVPNDHHLVVVFIKYGIVQDVCKGGEH